jgi:hypothetical protein
MTALTCSGPREVVIVDEFNLGRVVEGQVKGESGVVEEDFSGMGALGKPLELAELLGIGEGGAADREIKDAVVPVLTIDVAAEQRWRRERAASDVENVGSSPVR